jgi:hypothetical protein
MDPARRSRGWGGLIVRARATATALRAHSMGNCVFQRAMQLAWSRRHLVLLVNLLNQLLMVAADVDKDLPKSGKVAARADGDAIGSLTYRMSDGPFIGQGPSSRAIRGAEALRKASSRAEWSRQDRSVSRQLLGHRLHLPLQARPVRHSFGLFRGAADSKPHK